MTTASLDDRFKRLAGRARHDPHHREVRLAVRFRARDACEYCLLPTSGQFEVDHIIPLPRWTDYAAGRIRDVQPRPERSRLNHLMNVAWTCRFCNLAKGPHIQHRLGRRSYRLFDPRFDRWEDHFRFLHQYLFIIGITSVGMVTEAALGFNRPTIEGPVGTRHELIVSGQYPPQWARALTDRPGLSSG